MTQKYNPSRGGHAPGHLRDAMLRALSEARDNEAEAWWKRLELRFSNKSQQFWWDDWSPHERAFWLSGQLWNCGDILPAWACAVAGLADGSSYSKLARQLRNEVIQVLLQKVPGFNVSRYARLIREDMEYYPTGEET
jgi:hypothetical protein